LQDFMRIEKEDLRRALEILTEKEHTAFNELSVFPGHSDYTRYYDSTNGFNIEVICEEYLKAADAITSRCHITDACLLVNSAVAKGEKALIEMSQGAMLDVDVGTRPFVTSSHPIAGGACIGLPVGPKLINRIYMVMKGITTRVGKGPFPTRDDELGLLLRGLPTDFDGEYGVTTGRDRDIGHGDLVTVRSAAMWNSATDLFFSKLDALDILPVIKIAEAYMINGERREYVPLTLEEWEVADPIYKEFEGWMTSTRDCRKPGDLPDKARVLLDFVAEELTKVPGCSGLKLFGAGVGPEVNEVVIFEEEETI